MILRHSRSAIFLHWLNACCWIFLLFSGFALLAEPVQPIGLWWHEAWLAVFSKEKLLLAHIIIGCIWLGVFAAACVIFRKSVVCPFIGKVFRFSPRSDMVWCIKKGLSLTAGTKAMAAWGLDPELPPQGFYNAGQRMVAVFAIVCSALLGLTGIILTFANGLAPFFIQSCLVLHFTCAGIMAILLPVHIYMASLAPGEAPSLRSMFTGYVPKAFAKQHNPLWYEELQKKRQIVLKKVIPDSKDFLLSSYKYELPESQIAQFPCAERGSSRLMLLKNSDPPRHELFSALPGLLPPNCLLVANNSRVVQARLKGARPGGGKAEFLLLTPIALLQKEDLGGNRFQAKAAGLVRPAAKIRINDILRFGEDLELQITAKSEFGHCQGILTWNGDLADCLTSVGLLPLPPYIKREPEQSDLNRYQTVYASRAGSVAAPTAGLHFTDDMLQKLREQGHEWVEVSLHVGYGTFSPARAEDIRQHQMHAEYVEISESAARAINTAMERKRPIIAVGTTSLRAMEGVARQNGRLEPYSGMINLFLYPGQEIRIASGIITNFHLPCSTLLMLAAALAGRERILAAYREAVLAGYKFFSYGDAMLIY